MILIYYIQQNRYLLFSIFNLFLFHSTVNYGIYTPPNSPQPCMVIVMNTNFKFLPIGTLTQNLLLLLETRIKPYLNLFNQEYNETAKNPSLKKSKFMRACDYLMCMSNNLCLFWVSKTCSIAKKKP